MINKIKRLAGIFLVVLIIVSTTLSVYGVESSVSDVKSDQYPGGDIGGTGNSGGWYKRGYMFKVDFYKPSEYGLTSDPGSWEYKYVDGVKVPDMHWESLDSRALFERAFNNGKGGMFLPNYNDWGETAYDSAKRCQLYMSDPPTSYNGWDPKFGWVDVSFKEPNKSNDDIGWSNPGENSHRTFSTGNVKGSDSFGFRFSTNGGMISKTNPLVIEFMNRTSNGAVWSNKDMPGIITELWNAYVSHTANLNGSFEKAVNLRKDVVAMTYDEDSWVESLKSWKKLFDSIKVGERMNGVVIESDRQAANIKQFYLLSMAFVISNPAEGLTIKDVYIDHSKSFKGNSLLGVLTTWSSYGGNADSNYIKTHLSIRVEMYGNRIDDSINRAYVYRWDVAEYFATINVPNVQTISLNSRYNRCNNPRNPDYYGYRGVLNPSNYNEFYRELFYNIFERVRVNSTNGVLLNKSTEWFSVWQKPYPTRAEFGGGLYDDGKQGWAWRANCTFESPGFGNGGRTVNSGFTYISVSGKIPAENGESKRVNAKMDATVSSTKNELLEGESGESTVNVMLNWPSVLSNSVVSSQNIRIPEDTWRNPIDEQEVLLQTIHRAQSKGQVVSGDKNALLPVTVLIRRTKSAPDADNTDPVIDELFGGFIDSCGEHDLKYKNNSDGTSTVTFNIVPHSGSCGSKGKEYTIDSPLTGKKEKVNNCIVDKIFSSSNFKLSFKDTGIDISDEYESTTNVSYSFEVTVGNPQFVENIPAYGNSSNDLMGRGGNIQATGYRILPNGKSYPDSDYKLVDSKFEPSNIIIRSIPFVRLAPPPEYDNVGFEENGPWLSEIKQGSPGHEEFEAMAGVPTTRDLYASVSGTEFRVAFKAGNKTSVNNPTYRTYKYVVNVNGCSDGKHTFTYNLNIPIDKFTYFDMLDSEVWSQDEWGITPTDSFTGSDISKKTGVLAWVYNGVGYSSNSGRVIFNNSMNYNENGDKAPWGDNVRTINIDCTGNYNDAAKAAANAANNAKNSEGAVSGMIISDFIVLRTSEGFQVPYLYTQKFSNSVNPANSPNFSGDGGTVTANDTLRVDKQLDVNDFWYKNSNYLNCARDDNGWNNDSITHAGYNGNWGNVNSKYENSRHEKFTQVNNPLEKELSSMGWSLSKYYPNLDRGGSGDEGNPLPFSYDEDNKAHIKTGIDIVDTFRNGKVDTGSAWTTYNRFSHYRNNVNVLNSDYGYSKFPIDSSSPNKWGPSTIPYYVGGSKINDIIVHNPVSSMNVLLEQPKDITDQRTSTSLESGGDPGVTTKGVCPEVGCQFSTLTCTTELTPHDPEKCYVTVNEVTSHKGGNNIHVHTDDCYTESGELECTHELNEHKCFNCVTTSKKILDCNNPHHYTPGEPVNRDDPKYHYPIGDERCWTRCGDDSKHGYTGEVKLPDGTVANQIGTSLFIDHSFRVYYPYVGDFAGDVSLNGIKEITQTRGKGYVNNMNTKEWTKNRWVTFPLNVIGPDGKMYTAGTHIDLNTFSRDDVWFTFYVVLGNLESSNSQFEYVTTAINHKEDFTDGYYNESYGSTNRDRVDNTYGARHTSSMNLYADVVGHIGNISINDTGDYRFANLFKKEDVNASPLVPGLVPGVDMKIPNYVVGDKKTILGHDATKDTHWLDTYGSLYNENGGKSGGSGFAKPPLELPLVPAYNNIPSLREEPLRPGYMLYMDVETVGNYYGENLSEDKKFVDSNMVNKMQIRPKYYALDLDTNQYTPVDVYYGSNSNYKIINDYDNPSTNISDYYIYMEWPKEFERRNNTEEERRVTDVAKRYRKNNVYGFLPDTEPVRSPSVDRDVLGTSNIMFLNDLNRTFIGNTETYGVDKNPGSLVDEGLFNMQSQRWHFSLGLPSSAVFVESGIDCNVENIEKLRNDGNKVIVGTIEIKVKGDVWTLEYDSSAMNEDGFKIFEDGKTFNPPDKSNGGGDGNEIIYVIYPIDKTSKDDITYGGTH